MTGKQPTGSQPSRPEDEGSIPTAGAARLRRRLFVALYIVALSEYFASMWLPAMEIFVFSPPATVWKGHECARFAAASIVEEIQKGNLQVLLPWSPYLIGTAVNTAMVFSLLALSDALIVIRIGYTFAVALAALSVWFIPTLVTSVAKPLAGYYVWAGSCSLMALAFVIRPRPRTYSG